MSSAPSHRCVTASMPASHGADCPAECCLYRRIGAYGLRRSHRCLAISSGPWWSSVRYRPPSSVKKAGSSSRELGSPPEFVVPTSARVSKPRLRETHDHGRLPWGSTPLRDISPASPRPMSIPGPPLFRPQRFTRSRRLTPRSALQTYFILLPRPGFALQGLPPPTQPNHLVGGPSLLAVGTARLSPVAR